MTYPIDTIYVHNGATTLSVPVTDSAERSHSLQQHNYVKLVWKSADNIPIVANAYIEYEGQVFYCLDDYYPTHKDGIYEYDIEFHSIEDTFNRPIFFRYVEVTDQSTNETTSWKEAEWSLYGNISTIGNIIITSLNKCGYNAEFLLYPSDEYKNTELKSYSFSGVSIADALSTVADENETEWWIEGTELRNAQNQPIYYLHFDRCEFGNTISLSDEYTSDESNVWHSGGLKSVSQSGNKNTIPSKIYVYGSERNILKKTIEEQAEGGKMNVSYDKRLRLPSGVITETLDDLGVELTFDGADSSIAIGGINNKFEQVKMFDEIYPKMTMTTTGVYVKNQSSETPTYWLEADKIKSLVVDTAYNDKINPGRNGLLIEGCTLMCTFTSGLLNGREFECAWEESTARIGLIPIDENDVQIPMGAYIPSVGDTFVLWNLAMPTSAVTDAQQELKAEAIEYIREIVTSITETECVSEPEAFRKGGYNQQMKVGQRITVTSDVFRNGKLASRVIRFSHKLTKPYDVSFTLASSRQVGRLAKLENLVADATQEAHSVGQIQRSISRRQWHDTEEMMQMLDSIQKQMVVVGDEQNAFVTSCQVNWNNATKLLTISKGYVEHQSYKPNNGDMAWSIEANQFNLGTIDPSGATPYYVFFICSKIDGIGGIDIDTALPQADDHNYYFVLGILSAEYEGIRVFNQSSGLTTLAGGTITTEVIQDALRQLIIDFTNKRIIARNGAEIIGNIKFLSANGNTLDFARAFEQSTTIDGGLVLTNDIEIKDAQGNTTTGLSGSKQTLRMWAGATKNNAQFAPFRVYSDGRVHAGNFFGFNGAFEINSSNFYDVCEYEVGSYVFAKIKYELTGGNIYLGDLSQIKAELGNEMICFVYPPRANYVGATITYYNPNGYSVGNGIDILPYNICNIDNFGTSVASGATLEGVGTLAKGVTNASGEYYRWSLIFNYVPYQIPNTWCQMIAMPIKVKQGVNIPSELEEYIISGSYNLSTTSGYFVTTTNCVILKWIYIKFD